MDPNHIPSADTLPGRLGLTEAQMQAAQEAIREAMTQSVPMSSMLGAFESILVNLDTLGAIEAVQQEIAEWRGLLHTSIAYRAFAAGREAGRTEAGNEKGQA